MKAAVVIAAASLGLVWASGTASATPLAPTLSAPTSYEPFKGAVEPVHYRRRAVRRHYSPGAVISFGPFVAPYHTYPYRRAYSPYHYRPSYSYPAYSYPSYGYGYPYGYGPSFSFGFRIR